MAEQPSLAAGNGKTGGVGGNGQVTSGHQLTAGRSGQGVHPGDHRLRQCLQGVHHAGADGKQLARLRQAGAGHVAKVVASAEHRAVGGQDHAARRAAAHGLQRLGKLQHQRQAQGVALVGAVQGDGGDSTLRTNQDVLVCHGRTPCA